jgi:hypothetical protein
VGGSVGRSAVGVMECGEVKKAEERAVWPLYGGREK